MYDRFSDIFTVRWGVETSMFLDYNEQFSNGLRYYLYEDNSVFFFKKAAISKEHEYHR